MTPTDPPNPNQTQPPDWALTLAKEFATILEPPKGLPQPNTFDALVRLLIYFQVTVRLLFTAKTITERATRDLLTTMLVLMKERCRQHHFSYDLLLHAAADLTNKVEAAIGLEPTAWTHEPRNSFPSNVVH